MTRKSSYLSSDSSPREAQSSNDSPSPTGILPVISPQQTESTANSLPPLPPITNRPDEILSAWTALEVLSPPAYDHPEDLAGGDRSRVAKLSEGSLPWERSEKSKPNMRLYYQVVLGSIKMEPAVARLISRFGDDRPEKPTTRRHAVLAVVVVDSQGRL